MQNIASRIAAAALAAVVAHTSLASAATVYQCELGPIPTPTAGTPCPSNGNNSTSIVLATASHTTWGYKVKLTKIIPGTTVRVGTALINGAGGFAKSTQTGFECPQAVDITFDGNFGGNQSCQTAGSGSASPVKGRVFYNVS